MNATKKRTPPVAGVESTATPRLQDDKASRELIQQPPKPLRVGVNVIWLPFDLGRASALESSAAHHGPAAEDNLRAEGDAGPGGR